MWFPIAWTTIFLVPYHLLPFTFISLTLDFTIIIIISTNFIWNLWMFWFSILWVALRPQRLIYLIEVSLSILHNILTQFAQLFDMWLLQLLASSSEDILLRIIYLKSTILIIFAGCLGIMLRQFSCGSIKLVDLHAPSREISPRHRILFGYFVVRSALLRKNSCFRR